MSPGLLQRALLVYGPVGICTGDALRWVETYPRNRMRVRVSPAHIVIGGTAQLLRGPL